MSRRRIKNGELEHGCKDNLESVQLKRDTERAQRDILKYT